MLLAFEIELTTDTSLLMSQWDSPITQSPTGFSLNQLPDFLFSPGPPSDFNFSSFKPVFILFLHFLSSSHLSFQFSVPPFPCFWSSFPSPPSSWSFPLILYSSHLLFDLSLCALELVVSFVDLKGNVESQNHQRPLETVKSASTWCVGTRTKRS